MKKHIETKYVVVYGATDSLFIHIPTFVPSLELENWANSSISGSELRVSVALRTPKLFLHSKNKYVYLDHFSLLFTGLNTRSNSKYAATVLEKLVTLLFQDKKAWMDSCLKDAIANLVHVDRKDLVRFLSRLFLPDVFFNRFV